MTPTDPNAWRAAATVGMLAIRPPSNDRRIAQILDVGTDSPQVIQQPDHTQRARRKLLPDCKGARARRHADHGQALDHAVSLGSRQPRLDGPGRANPHWFEHDQGGHFPSLEESELLVDDLRTFFRGLRGNDRQRADPTIRR